MCGEPVVVFGAAAGRPATFLDCCPHRGAALSAGEVRDGCLQCPYHGWRFDGEGRCVEIPALDAGAVLPPRARLDPLAMRVEFVVHVA